MGHEANITGVVQTIKYGETNVAGVVQTIRYGETNVAGVVQTLPFESGDSSFANTPWSEIVSRCQAAIEGSLDPSDEEMQSLIPWNVGDEKTLRIGGEEHTVVIIGKWCDIDEEGKGSLLPLTLQLKDCCAVSTMSDADEGFDDSTPTSLYTTVLPALFEQIEESVRAGIEPVGKWHNDYNGEAAQYYSGNLFLLDDKEVFGEAGDCASTPLDESAQYEFYALGGSKAKSYLGTPCAWWLRSAADNAFAGCFSCVTADGEPLCEELTASLGVSFAFCL